MTEQDYSELELRHGIPRRSASVTKHHPMWSKLYYGEQPKKAREHLAKLAKDFPAEAAIFAPAVEDMLVGLVKAEADRAEKKAALQKRRDERADRARQRANLGIDLQKREFEFATVETYTEMRDGLKPIEDALREYLTSDYTEKFTAINQKLAEHGFDSVKAFPHRNRDGSMDPHRCEIPHPLFWKLFSRTCTPHIVAARPNASEVITAEAKKDADNAVAGFAGKMAAKIDRELCNNDRTTSNRGKVLAVECKGDMWQYSILTVKTDRGTQIWHTQVIWNTSVLGKSFNQWPTRRIDARAPAATPVILS
jgi:hypothetical protein